MGHRSTSARPADAVRRISTGTLASELERRLLGRMPSPDDMIGMRETARLMGKSMSWLAHARLDGRIDPPLKFYRTGARGLTCRRGDVEAWVAARAVTPPCRQPPQRTGSDDASAVER